MSANNFNEKSDVYSYGVILWELWTRSNPCPSEMPHHHFARKICAENYRPPIPDDIPDKWVKLIENCWSTDSTSRPSLNKILDQLVSFEQDILSESPPNRNRKSPPDIHNSQNEDTTILSVSDKKYTRTPFKASSSEVHRVRSLPKGRIMTRKLPVSDSTSEDSSGGISQEDSSGGTTISTIHVSPLEGRPKQVILDSYSSRLSFSCSTEMEYVSRKV